MSMKSINKNAATRLNQFSYFYKFMKGVLMNEFRHLIDFYVYFVPQFKKELVNLGRND